MPDTTAMQHRQFTVSAKTISFLCAVAAAGIVFCFNGNQPATVFIKKIIGQTFTHKESQQGEHQVSENHSPDSNPLIPYSLLNRFH